MQRSRGVERTLSRARALFLWILVGTFLNLVAWPRSCRGVLRRGGRQTGPRLFRPAVSRYVGGGRLARGSL